MAFNGSGTFNRLYNWVTDAANTIKIRADRMDAEMDGMATGLSQCITKNGETTVTADLPMATYKHTNVGDASARTHYAKVSQIQDGDYTELGSVSGTDTITASASPAITAYAAGQVFRFVAAGANTGATTLNINSVGAVAIEKRQAALAAGDIASGDVVEVYYDGSKFQILSPIRVEPLAGADGTILTGTVGTDGNLAQWNGDGDLVDGPDVLDEDNLASDSATDLATQQSIKAYVDNNASNEDLISTTTISSDATVDLTGFDSATYIDYRIVLDWVIPATDTAHLWLRTSSDGGSSFGVAADDYAWIGGGALGTTTSLNGGDASDSEISISGAIGANGVGSGSNEGLSGEIRIINPEASAQTRVIWHVTGFDSASNYFVISGGGQRLDTQDTDAVRLLFSSGNLASGTVRFYGRKS